MKKLKQLKMKTFNSFERGTGSGERGTSPVRQPVEGIDRTFWKEDEEKECPRSKHTAGFLIDGKLQPRCMSKCNPSRKSQTEGENKTEDAR